MFKDKLYSLENRLASWWKASSYLLWLGHTGVKIGWQPACDYEKKKPQNIEVCFFFVAFLQLVAYRLSKQHPQTLGTSDSEETAPVAY